MKTRYWFALFTGLLTYTGMVHADAECKKFVMTGDSGYPPLEWRDRIQTDKMTMIATELVEMAMKDQGIPVESKYVGPWKRAQEVTKEGGVDALTGYINEDRKKFLDYVEPPYLMDPNAVFVRKGRPFKFTKKEDLLGLKGSTVLGESYGEEFDKFDKEQLKLDRSTSVQVAFKKLLNDRTDFVVYGLYAGAIVADQEGISNQLETLPNYINSEGMYIAISKKSPCAKYRDYLSKKMAEYVKAGVPDTLLKKYKQMWAEQSKLKKPDN